MHVESLAALSTASLSALRSKQNFALRGYERRVHPLLRRLISRGVSLISPTLVVMLHSFVDESERGDTHYFLGALVVNDEQAEKIREYLSLLVDKHAETFPHLAGVELHGSTMMRANEEPWRSVPLRVRFRIMEEVMEAVAYVGARVYIEGVDIVRQMARGYPTITPARELAFSHLFERINECCDWHEPKVRVVADEHHTAEVSRSNFNSYQSVGTYGYRSSRLRNISEQIDFIESHTDRVLQAADLITYLYNRMMTVQETDMRAHRQKVNMWSIIDEAARWPRGRARIWP